MAGEPARLTSEVHVSIASPRRYLGQLCKHFGHKMPVSYEPDYRSGRIEIPDLGVCALEADEEADVLIMRASATHADHLASLEGVIGRHLERFAFRDPVTIAWTRLA